MTGIIMSQPSEQSSVVASPVWRFDATAKRVQLLGMLPVAQSLARARQVDQLQGEELAAALKLLGEMYREPALEMGEMVQYVEYVEKQREQIQQQGWKLDLSLLGL
jgi:hypothetical protein